MSHGTRRIVFYFFVILFIAVGTAIVSYSQGWGFDFRTGSFDKTGGIYVKSDPADAGITLDGKTVPNQSGLLQSGTLVSNLAKGSYILKVFKDGYSLWEKKVEVKPGGAEVFDKVLLLPKETTEKISKASESFAMFNNDAVQVKNGTIIFKDRVIPGNKVVSLSPAGRIITMSGKGVYYLTDLSQSDSASLNLNKLFLNLKESELNLPGIVGIDKIEFHPFDDSRVIIETPGGLYILDSKKISIELIASNPLGFASSNDQLIWASSDGLQSYNLVIKSSTKISDTFVGASGAAVKIGISPSGSEIAVLEKTGMFKLFDYSKGTVQKIADKVSQFSFSPNSRYLAYADYDGPVSVYRIDRPEYLGLDGLKGEAVSRLEWYKDSAHLFTLRGGALNLIEVDSGTPVNATRISDGVTQFDYPAGGETVYYLTSDGLFSFKTAR